MKRIIKYFLVLVSSYTGYSYAVCTRTDIPATILTIDLGTVIVNPNAKVGDIIAQHSWSLGDTGNLFKCSTGDQLTGYINTSILTNNGTQIHQTNIPGVGMRIERLTSSGGTTSAVYPYTQTRPNNNYVYISPSLFQVTLYKTSEDIGSGPLTSGLYTWWSPTGSGSSQSALTSQMTEKGTTIVSPSCTVVSGAQQNVYLEPINYTQLKTVGSTAGDTSFSIQLRCSGGASLNVGYDNVELTFTGTIPSSLSNSDGVLINDVESTGAQGVGIQVLDNTKKAIIFDNKYTIGSLTGAVSGYNVDTYYTARYYRYGSTINPGVVEAKMIFAITYD